MFLLFIIIIINSYCKYIGQLFKCIIKLGHLNENYMNIVLEYSSKDKNG